MTTLAVNVLQYAALILGAPLLRALIARMKAIMQRRQGSNLWRPYADLMKLLRKEDLVPPTATPLFRLAPMVLAASNLVAAAMIPTVYHSALLGFAGDFIIFVYVLALGRFFMGLGALDGSSSFAGMGASREAMVAALAEAPLFLGLIAVAILAGQGNIVGIVRWTLAQNFFDVSAVHAVAFVALAIVAIAETGRMPVDNPTTHLELTMIHEAMVLEYSGPSLALIEWAQAIKLTVILSLLIGLFAPWGMASNLALSSLVLGFGAFLLKLVALAVVIAVLESSIAKLRMYLVPQFLGIATALGALAIVFTALMRK
jgi:formate hydrogenlyase subunit 4